MWYTPVWRQNVVPAGLYLIAARREVEGLTVMPLQVEAAGGGGVVSETPAEAAEHELPAQARTTYV
jgi:hypothetical protein